MGLSVICVYPIARVLGVAALWGVRWLADAAVQTRAEIIVQNLGTLIF